MNIYLYTGLSLCSQQRSPARPEIATRGIRDRLQPSAAAAIQKGRGEGDKINMPPIQSNEELKNVLRQAKEPNSNLVRTVYIHSFSIHLFSLYMMMSK
jgi:hypothetical protein